MTHFSITAETIKIEEKLQIFLKSMKNLKKETPRKEQRQLQIQVIVTPNPLKTLPKEEREIKGQGVDRDQMMMTLKMKKTKLILKRRPRVTNL